LFIATFVFRKRFTNMKNFCLLLMIAMFSCAPTVVPTKTPEPVVRERNVVYRSMPEGSENCPPERRGCGYTVVDDAGLPFLPDQLPLDSTATRAFIGELYKKLRYPVSLEGKQWEGTVVLGIDLDKDGNYQSTFIADNHPREPSAEDAVIRAAQGAIALGFRLMIIDGQAEPATLLFPVKFKLLGD